MTVVNRTDKLLYVQRKCYRGTEDEWRVAMCSSINKSYSICVQYKKIQGKTYILIFKSKNVARCGGYICSSSTLRTETGD